MKNIFRILITSSFLLLIIMIVIFKNELTKATRINVMLDEQILEKDNEIEELNTSYDNYIIQSEIDLDKQIQTIKSLQKINEENMKDLATSNEKIEVLSSTSKSFRILAYGNGVLRYVYEENEKENYQIPISIIGYNTSGLLLPGEEIETLDYADETGARVKLKVLGSLYDFKIVKLGWDSVIQDTYEESIICELDEVRNKDILFSSSQSEGMNSEVIKWRDTNGNEHEYYIAYDGFGFAGKIILVENDNAAD